MNRLWAILLGAALLFTGVPAAFAEDAGGIKITLDSQAAGAKTLSGKLTNVPSNVKQVAVTLKVNANLQQFQIATSDKNYAFSFNDVTTWQSLSALPVSPGGMGRMASVTMTSTGDTTTTTATSSSLPYYGGSNWGGYGPGYGFGGGYGPGYSYSGGAGAPYCGTGYAYTYTQPGQYGYPFGLNTITGYYLSPYYRFYQPTPNWMYQPYAYYGLSPYSYGC